MVNHREKLNKRDKLYSDQVGRGKNVKISRVIGKAMKSLSLHTNQK